jgi:two-component system, LytTR family, response regulator
VRVVLEQIQYIEGLKDYVKIYLDNTSHIIKSTMSGFETNLSDSFIRVHRSYIVNIDKVTAYSTHSLELGEIDLPIGDVYRTSLFNKLALWGGLNIE